MHKFTEKSSQDAMLIDDVFDSDTPAAIELPNEMLYEIFSYLDPVIYYLKLSMNRHYLEIIKNHAHWKNIYSRLKKYLDSSQNKNYYEIVSPLIQKEYEKKENSIFIVIKFCFLETFLDVAKNQREELLNLKDSNQENILQVAVRYGRLDIVQAIFENELFSDVKDKLYNEKTSENDCILKLAILCDEPQIANYLMNLYEGINSQNDELFTENFFNQGILREIYSKGLIQVAQYFRQHLNVDSISEFYSETPLCLAITGGNFEMAKFLVSQNASTNIKEGTLFHDVLNSKSASIDFENLDIEKEKLFEPNILLQKLQFLIEIGLKDQINKPNHHNYTPLDLVNEQNSEIIKFLRSHGAKTRVELDLPEIAEPQRAPDAAPLKLRQRRGRGISYPSLFQVGGIETIDREGTNPFLSDKEKTKREDEASKQGSKNNKRKLEDLFDEQKKEISSLEITSIEQTGGTLEYLSKKLKGEFPPSPLIPSCLRKLDALNRGFSARFLGINDDSETQITDNNPGTSSLFFLSNSQDEPMEEHEEKTEMDVENRENIEEKTRPFNL